MPDDDRGVVRVERDGGVGQVVLDRPQALNALDLSTMERLLEVLGSLAGDQRVRAVVLRGAGRAFCAGGDVELIRQRRAEVAAAPSLGQVLDRQHRALVRHADSVRLLREMPKPTLAVVHGPAVGGGLALALACDVRLVAADAPLRVGFAGRALSGDFGMTYLLVQAVGAARARELLLLDPELDGLQASQLGLFTEAVPQEKLEERARLLADRLAGGPTVAFARMKDNVRAAESAAFAQAIEAEALNQRVSGNTADAVEAGAAFQERRAPRFHGQ